MNVKLWAGIAVVIVVLAGTGWYMSSNTNNDDSMVIVSRVNTDGSGIFGEPTINVTQSDGKWVQSGWGGKRFATPGPTSIQHMILQNLVVNDFGMKFSIVPSGGTLENDTVYWVQMGVGAMKESYDKFDIEGGILWEADFTDVIKNSVRGAKSVVTTRQLDPGHACCVIGVNRTYLQNNSEDVIRFLSAYVEVVNWMNEALLEGTNSAKYLQLRGYAETFTNKSAAVIDGAFANLTYEYEMSTMKEDIVNMVNTYQSTGLISNTVQDLGFQNELAFADWLVNDTYLSNATNRNADYYSNAPKITVTVAHLVYDIHQLALYVGSDDALGTFSKYGITVQTLPPYQAGGPVAQALVRGEANIGFLGAPPVVQTTINMGR